MTTTINGVQYREVMRKAKAGEKIKIVAASLTFGDYGNGDVFTVISEDCTGSGNGVKANVQEVKNDPDACTLIAHSEYVVLEPVAPADTIVHNGVQYRKVDRPVREGDAFIVAKEDGIDITAGKVYALERAEDGRAIFFDNVGVYRKRRDYYVLEPVAPASLSALETELAATKAKVTEMEAQLAEAVAAQRKKAETEAQRLKVGDYAKVVQSGHGNYGKIVKITRDDRPGQYVYGTEHLNGVGADIHTPSQLTRATDEEITEAKRKLELHEIEAKWHAIGREVGEFKRGDVVKLTQNPGGHLRKGDVTILESVNGDDISFGGGYIGRISWIELVAPVESIANLSAS